MALTLTIAGVDRTSLLRTNSLNIADLLNARNTCSFTLKSEDGSYRPSVGATVTITDGSTTHYGGTIDSVDEQKLDEATAAITYNVSLVDFNQLADRHLVARVYETAAQTLGDIVTDIVTQDLAGEGITTTGVQAGPTIIKAVFNYVPAAQAFNELSELTGYAWNINYSKVLHFFARETNAAPFSLTDSSGDYRRMRVRRTREQYRNRQLIRAGVDLTDPRTESFKGDGTNKSFLLSFPVGAVPTSITVNAVSKTIGIRGVDSGKDWYWSKGDSTISQDDGGTAIASSDTLAVTYQGLFPIIVSSQLDDQISERSAAEGGTGVYEAVDEDSNVDDGDLALDKANGLLRRFGAIPVIVEFETDVKVAPTAGGLAAGQLISITNTAHGLSGQYLIDSVTAEDVDGGWLRYQVRALSGESVGGWVDFFAKLAQSGRRFVIRDNEVLMLLRRFEDEVVCGDSATYTSAAPESRADFATADFSEAA